MLLHLALPLIVQHWLVAILGAVAMLLLYLAAFKADQYCIVRFGDAHKRCMQSLLRVNFAEGTIGLPKSRIVG